MKLGYPFRTFLFSISLTATETDLICSFNHDRGLDASCHMTLIQNVYFSFLNLARSTSFPAVWDSNILPNFMDTSSISPSLIRVTKSPRQNKLLSLRFCISCGSICALRSQFLSTLDAVATLCLRLEISVRYTFSLHMCLYLASSYWSVH